MNNYINPADFTLTKISALDLEIQTLRRERHELSKKIAALAIRKRRAKDKLRKQKERAK